MPTKPGPVTGTDQAHEVDATWLPKSRMAPTQRVSFHSQEISNMSNRLRRHVGTIYQMIIHYIILSIYIYIYDTQAWRYQDSWWIDQGPAVRWWVTFQNLLLGWDGPGPYTIRVSSQCTWIGRLSDQPCSIRISIIYIYMHICVYISA